MTTADQPIVIHEPGMTDRQRQAMYAEVATERHPSWCQADPGGCAGAHVSKPVDLTGHDRDGELPLGVCAIYEDATDARTVEITAEFVGSVAGIHLTEVQARALAAALTDAADLLAKPWATWSWPLEQVEAYADAMLSGRYAGQESSRSRKPAGGAQ
jgi:hypothetical protein